MTNTGAPTLLATSIPKSFQETVEIFADVLKMLDADKLEEEVTLALEAFAEKSTRNMLAEKGAEHM